LSATNIKDVVKEKYGSAALRVTTGDSSCCDATPATGSSCCDPITSNLYEVFQTQEIPEEALQASLGCGNPTALAKLNPGEVVLDLGSGGASTFYSQPDASGQQGKPMAST
jgi:arsenite methyltransferase